MPRIVSFLPAGTEIVHALGAGNEIVGRSHECDYPSSVRMFPVVSRPALDLDGASPDAIDLAIAERMDSGDTLYTIDEVLHASGLFRAVLSSIVCLRSVARVAQKVISTSSS